MQIVIDIPEETINRVKSDQISVMTDVSKLIKNSTLLTESDDCVSRADVLKGSAYTSTEEGWEGYTIEEDYVKSLPSVQPKPKVGHWTERKIHETTGFFLPTCSECGRIQPYAHHTFSWNYCPNCGAKMESEEKNE